MVLAFSAGLLLLVNAGCGSPTKPSIVTPPPTDAPAIACPSVVTAQSPDGSPVRVTYTDPVVTGGLKPLALVCTPASGATFIVGATTVACSVSDAQQRTSNCLFQVNVVRPSGPPRLSVTRFLAFGDSITAGFVPDSTDSLTAGITFRIVQPDLAYPSRLEAVLRGRYAGQTVTVVNRGVPGEKTVEGAGRLPGDLVRFGPDVLLLQEGVNDVNATGAAAIPGAIQNLRTMIRSARGRGARVIVGTLLPQIPGLHRAVAPELMAAFNAQLVPMATSEGASIVDLYTGFLVDLKAWISPLDGLHPTPAGYSEMARLFSTRIIPELESPASVTAPARVR